jgi:hypothetical protein
MAWEPARRPLNATATDWSYAEDATGLSHHGYSTCPRANRRLPSAMARQRARPASAPA